jgi:hypothetical protein
MSYFFLNTSVKPIKIAIIPIKPASGNLFFKIKKSKSAVTTGTK